MDEASPDSEGTFADMDAAFFSSEMQACLAGIRQIAHFDITPNQAQPFLRFHHFINSPRPQFISQWRAEPKLKRWYHSLVNGVLGDVRSALAAVEYHRANVVRIETELGEFLETVDYKKVMLPGSMVGGGSSGRLDFEYQAYVIAYRRCLDYLTRALASYFMRLGGGA